MHPLRSVEGPRNRHRNASWGPRGMREPARMVTHEHACAPVCVACVWTCHCRGGTAVHGGPGVPCFWSTNEFFLENSNFQTPMITASCIIGVCQSSAQRFALCRCANPSPRSTSLAEQPMCSVHPNKRWRGVTHQSTQRVTTLGPTPQKNRASQYM